MKKLVLFVLFCWSIKKEPNHLFYFKINNYSCQLNVVMLML